MLDQAGMKPHEPFDPNKDSWELDLDDEIDSNEPGSNEPNEGEGSRTAARSYQEKLEAFIADGRVAAAARDAARAVDGPEGPELRAAEEAGKAPARTSKIQRFKGMARAFVDGAKAAYEEAKRK